MHGNASVELAKGQALGDGVPAGWVSMQKRRRRQGLVPTSPGPQELFSLIIVPYPYHVDLKLGFPS